MPGQGIQGLTQAGGGSEDFPKPPKLPKDIKDRFPSMLEWEEKFDEWVKKLVTAMKKS